MIEWIRIEPGHYKNKNGRFIIRKNEYGFYKWRLEDYNAIAKEGYYKGIYNEKTLLDCKLQAEQILEYMPPEPDTTTGQE